MRILMLFIFSSMAFAETNRAEEAKAETTKQQKLEMKEIEVVEDISEAKPEPKEKKVSEKSVSEEDAKSEKAESGVVELSETELVSGVETEAGVSLIAGVKYVCDDSRSYTFYEPGNDPNHLCELEAGHTEQPTDWYALNESSFCRTKMEELVSQYNCAQETK
ncbi:MAG: hypothetical protein OXN83_03705 [Oligoflexia bacterium]|nr:hypothetical protein [Oligoflexia bacterium]